MTAVQWIINELKHCIELNKSGITSLLPLSWIEETAIEMEKQQIEDAHIEGQRVFDKHQHTQWTNDQAEHYYNETYRSKK